MAKPTPTKAKKAPQNQNYACGRANEVRLAKALKRNGHTDIKISPGSRGAADITCKKPGGQRWCVQVKSTCQSSNSPHKITPKEKSQLIALAQKTGATPVVTYVKGGKAEAFSAKTGRKLSFK